MYLAIKSGIKRTWFMISVFNTRSSGSGWSPGNRPYMYVVFLGEIYYSHSASCHPGVQLGTGKFNATNDYLAFHLHVVGSRKYS